MIERKTVSQCVSEDYCKGWNDAVDAMPKWISVEDDLPALVVTPCLIYGDGWIQIAEWTHDKLGLEWWFHVDGEYDPEVSHWMPLPEPPKEAML